MKIYKFLLYINYYYKKPTAVHKKLPQFCQNLNDLTVFYTTCYHYLTF